MKMLLTLITGLGVVLLTGSLGLPVAAAQMPDAPEPGEVEIITPTLPSVGDIVGRFNDPAVREVEVRGLVLTQEQVNEAFLSTDPTKNVLTQIGRQLPEGTEVDFRTVDGQRFRVQNEEGELRVRLRDVSVSGENGATLARALAGAGIGRVEIRGVDAAGNRIRLEIRDGVVKKDEVKAAGGGGRGRTGTSASINNERAADRGRDLDHSIRGRDRAERPERREQSERADRSGRSGRN